MRIISIKILPCAVVILLLPIHGNALVQNQATQSAPKIPLMRQIYVQDQRDRGVELADDGGPVKPGDRTHPAESLDAATMQKRDAERRKQVRELLAAGKVTTAQDFHDAAFVFQHGSESQDYLLAHILATNAVAKGDSTSRWIAAATLDRYLQSIGQKQVFGTQYLSGKYAWYLGHKNDPDMAEKFKTIPDTDTQQPYDEQLVPDTVRLEFCVPPREQQAQNLKIFQAGSYPEHIIPSGCTR